VKISGCDVMASNNIAVPAASEKVSQLAAAQQEVLGYVTLDWRV
jgi:hypothetical protein